MTDPESVRTFGWPQQLNFVSIVETLRRGPHDPTFQLTADQLEGDTVWRAAHTPNGPVLQQLVLRAGIVTSRCWGPGAVWMSHRTEDLLGLNDDATAFERLPAVASRLTAEPPGATPGGVPEILDLWRLHGACWRVPKAHNVWESVVGAVLEQKVTGLEARRAWIALAQQYGRPPPGPAPDGLRLLPGPLELRQVPSWWWRSWAVDRPRSDTLMRLSHLGHVLYRLPNDTASDARRKLTSIAGIGDWTYAEVAQRALGDPDAVSFGDFHLAGQVVFALTGEFGGTDEQMGHLLEPFTGQRYRVVRMIELAGVRAPRRGPRMDIPPRRYG